MCRSGDWAHTYRYIERRSGIDRKSIRRLANKLEFNYWIIRELQGRRTLWHLAEEGLKSMHIDLNRFNYLTFNRSDLIEHEYDEESIPFDLIEPDTNDTIKYLEDTPF